MEWNSCLNSFYIYFYFIIVINLLCTRIFLHLRKIYFNKNKNSIYLFTSTFQINFKK